ncbi:hypothetical protein VE03_05544 [Pseudogymnoascus sp. 23342-1-I1]|nr:hypothetical protein VE03_05544 [Pseudogymnoascus sp. 23342-1-I1]
MSPPEPPTRILILGSGILGSALAAHLSDFHDHYPIPGFTVQVLSPPSTHEPSIAHKSSTSLAPGLIGQLNALPPLTTLAKTSVQEYLTLPPGCFSQVGGLEIANTPEGIATLEQRLEQALAVGLEARLLDSEEVAGLAPQFHQPDKGAKGLYFPTDGVAEPERIVDAYQASARARDVEFIEATALGIKHLNGVVVGVRTTTGIIGADKVIVASGIWTPKIVEDLIHLPVIPVAHPYIHGPARPARAKETPFVRWPEKSVYARDHGACEGFGTYDHKPLPVEAGESAEKGWDSSFDSAAEKALSSFPEETRKQIQGEGSRRMNGVFAVTPDGLPIAGPVRGVEGLWVAAAVWITHAAGVAELVTGMVLGREDGGEEEVELRKALDPVRFEGREEEELKKESGGRYNDIYNLEE